MNHTKPIDLFAIGVMVLLCMIWGFQQITLKSTETDIVPMMQIALRSGISAGLVMLLMQWRSEGFGFFRTTWRSGLAAGALFTLEFVLVAEGLRLTSASHMVVFLYTAPIFAALGLHLMLPMEKLRPIQWLGIAIAFSGIAIAFLLPSPSKGQTSSLIGDLLGLLGGMAWGATTVVVRTTGLSRLPATQTLLYQLLVCCMVLGILTVSRGQAHIHWTSHVMASLVFQSLIVSFASFLAWFWLIRQYLASRIGIFAFMTPLFGVVFGVGLLGERLEHGFIFGSLLVLIGILLVSGAEWLAEGAKKKAA